LTLDSPAENLALDEALVDSAETHGEVLRLWEPREPFVVVGRGSRAEREVDLAACERLGIGVYRRASGGGAVVIGPGCLAYAVVLCYRTHPELRPLDAAHRYVLERIASAVSTRAAPVARAGTSDLVIGGSMHADVDPSPSATPRKCSGNSLRSQRDHFLYHGTLLYAMEFRLVESCLRMPPRAPAYRLGRTHSEFLVNLPLRAPELRKAVCEAWNATLPLGNWPRERTALLAKALASGVPRAVTA
jgi:lipoate-protein ligase A